MKNENDNGNDGSDTSQTSSVFINSEESAFSILIDDSEMNTLTITTLITKEMIGDSPFWRSVAELYQSHRFESRALASIINSVATQRRLIFILSKASLGRLFKDDPNWPERASSEINSSEYRRIIKLLFEGKHKYFDCLQASFKNEEGTRGKPFVAEVVGEVLISAIECLAGADRETIKQEQLQASDTFVNANYDLAEINEKILLADDRYDSRIEKGEDKSRAAGHLELDIKKILREFFETHGCNSLFLDKLRRNSFSRPLTKRIYLELLDKYEAAMKQ